MRFFHLVPALVPSATRPITRTGANARALAERPAIAEAAGLLRELDQAGMSAGAVRATATA